MGISRLIIVGSQYQIILLLRIQRIFKINDITDVIIFQSIPDSERICNELMKLSLFRSVKVVTDIQKSDTLINKVIDNIKICFGNAEKVSYFERLEINNGYDEIWYYNYCPWFYILQDFSSRKEKKLRWVRFAEGVFAYAWFKYGIKELRINSKFGMLTFIRKILGKPVIALQTDDVYMSFPDLMEKDERNRISFHKIPQLNAKDELFATTVRNIFQYTKEDVYPQFIVLASAVDVDGTLTDNQEAKKIIEFADVVGKENIIIKKHPRDKRSIFEQAGLRVVRNNIPIEILALCQDMANRCFVTVISSGSISMQLDTGVEVKTFFLYQLVENKTEKFKELCNRNNDLLYKLQKKGSCKETYVISDKKNLYELLGNIKTDGFG